MTSVPASSFGNFLSRGSIVPGFGMLLPRKNSLDMKIWDKKGLVVSFQIKNGIFVKTRKLFNYFILPACDEEWDLRDFFELKKVDRDLIFQAKVVNPGTNVKYEINFWFAIFAKCQLKKYFFLNKNYDNTSYNFEKIL